MLLFRLRGELLRHGESELWGSLVRKAKSRPDSYSQQTGARLNASQNVTCAEGLGSFRAKRSLSERGERFLEERPDRQTDITHTPFHVQTDIWTIYHHRMFALLEPSSVSLYSRPLTYSPARLPRPLTSSNVKLFYTIALVI